MISLKRFSRKGCGRINHDFSEMLFVGIEGGKLMDTI